MIINRHRNNDIPPKMTIYVAKDATAKPEFLQTPTSHEGTSKAPAPVEGEKTIEINMQNKFSDQILEYFMAQTRAVPLKPTEAELQEKKDLEALKEQSQVDHNDYMRRREEKNREQEMLKRARAAGGMADED